MKSSTEAAHGLPSQPLGCCLLLPSALLWLCCCSSAARQLVSAALVPRSPGDPAPAGKQLRKDACPERM